MTSAPSPWHPTIPHLQVAWDSSSLGPLMRCPREYQLRIIEGWRPSGGNVHLTFGRLNAGAAEVYKKSRLEGMGKEIATLRAMEWAIVHSWDPTSGPFGGSYEEQWRCTGTTPYKNAKGNKAKCPWSHSGQWFPLPAPEPCSCGSATETVRHWVAEDQYKDRPHLIRLVVGWCDSQPEEGGIELVQFPNGTPAVELSWSLLLPFTAQDGHRHVLCGHFDTIDRLGNEHFISDNKTTKKALAPQYWAQYSPNVQVDTYNLAGAVLYPALDIKGVRIDAAQVLTEGVRFGSRNFYVSEEKNEEYLEELKHYLTRAEEYAVAGHWPMNRTACLICPFKSVCSLDPSRREDHLKAHFVKEHWNPLEER